MKRKMATDDDNKPTDERETDEDLANETAASEVEVLAQANAPESEPDAEPTHLGAVRYVHAAFFAAGILVAFLSGKILALMWHALAGWPPAVQRVPALLRYAEDERDSFTMVAGAVIGVITVIQTYRKETIRTWANEVAAELAKVTWPTREAVTNGTIVVVIASMIATVYVTILDRFWGFLTNLVYGA
jgi:preprotein translocase subunit SecE